MGGLDYSLRVSWALWGVLNGFHLIKSCGKPRQPKQYEHQEPFHISRIVSEWLLVHSPAKCPLDRRVRRLAVAEPDALEWLLLRLPFGFPSANVPEVVGPWWFWKGNMRRQSGLNSSSCSMGTCAKHRASFSGNCQAQAKLMFILCRVILHFPVQPAINKLWGCN